MSTPQASFSETQKFAPAILWFMRIMPLFTIAIVTAALWGANVSAGMFAFIFVVSVAPLLLLVPLFELTRLKTHIDESGIHMSFKPFSQKHFSWNDIQSAKVINYGFVGGWGIRLWTKYGTVYNTQGSEGLSLTFKDGKKVVIGTQRRLELQNFLDQYFLNGWT